MRSLLHVTAVLCAVFALVQGDASADLITSLPGLAQMPSFKMYSGYITVDPAHGRSLFYFFAESQRNPTSDPIVLWQQGGPGCSSLVGMMTENGPLRATSNNGQISIEINGWSWNRFANMLYIDAPAGVGFSYSNTTSDYNTDNNKTATDNYVFLQKWFSTKFPQYANNSLWLTGESYGGDYVPQLAQKILYGNDAQLASRLKGFAVGNPVFSCNSWKAFQNNIQVNLFYWHGMLPLSIYSQWQQEGCGRAYPPAGCNDLMNQITDMIGDFDPDNLYSDLLLGNATLGVGPVVPANESVYGLRNTWLNRPDVQAAMHVQGHPTWVTCCSEVGQSGSPCQLNYTNNWTNMMPLYQTFFADHPSLRILVYSGDLDIATCPFAYAQLCLAELGGTPTRTWQPWTVPDAGNQTAGYVEVYPHYTYATVKAAGHEVPQFQPRTAYYMISNFINGAFP
eukprot:m.93570 g.93570  ORF g.93570 m.93570 type:complete len:452 (+) comp14707_c1_seq1:353-1708(+)